MGNSPEPTLEGYIGSYLDDGMSYDEAKKKAEIDISLRNNIPSYIKTNTPQPTQPFPIIPDKPPPEPVSTASPLENSPINTPTTPGNTLPLYLQQPIPSTPETPVADTSSTSTPPTGGGGFTPTQVPVFSSETQTKTSAGVPLSKGILDSIKKNQEEEAKVIDRQKKLNIEKNVIAQKQIADEQAEAELAKNQAFVREDFRRAAYNKYDVHLKDAMADVDNFKIDPKRVFGNDSWRSIGAAIAAGIGAYASALTGQPNFALQIIDKAIDRDIDAQKEELLKKKGKVGEIRNAYQDNLQRFKDEEMAEAATRMQQTAVTTLKYKEQLAKLGKTEAEINADANVIELTRRANDDKLKLETLMSKKVETVTSTSVQPKVLGLDANQRQTANREWGKEWQDISKPERTNLQDANKTLAMAKQARDNPAVTAPLITNFIRSFGSEKGTLSDGDIQRMKLDPSLKGQSIDWIEKNYKGTLSSESIGYLEKAIKERIVELNHNLAIKVKDYSTQAARSGINPIDVIPGADIDLLAGNLGNKKKTADQTVGNKGKRSK
jgi:hypothetical protein